MCTILKSPSPPLEELLLRPPAFLLPPRDADDVGMGFRGSADDASPVVVVLVSPAAIMPLPAEVNSGSML